MDKFLAFCLGRGRTVFLALAFFLIAGAYSYWTMPKESAPDIAIPIIYVEMRLEGISPEDGETMLVRPMEKELRGIEGVKEMTAQAVEGFASVTLEFEAGFDKNKALTDVREKVDLAKPELPQGVEEPTIHEVNFSLFPVLVVGLSGEVQEHALVRLARDLRDKIEAIPEVLEVKIQGDREEVVELVVDPSVLGYYDLEFEDVSPLVVRNNKLVAAGTLETEFGRMPVKVPGFYKTPEEIFNTPVKVDGDSVVRFRDVTDIRTTFKDPRGFARIDGRRTLALEVVKRTGENIINTIESVRSLVDAEARHWPEGLSVTYLQDQSGDIRMMLNDLQNNLISAVILVMFIVLGALGWRTSLLVGIAIPGSFLMGLWVLSLMGLTINNVVLFSLILAVGMLVDGAIIVTEFADRKMLEGETRKKAYLLASQRMALPVIASTATTLAAFMPLLFWPGVVGEFMKFLPITLICTLTASLVMALIFVPTLGCFFGKVSSLEKAKLQASSGSKLGTFFSLRNLTCWYIVKLRKALQKPERVAFATIALLFLVYGTKIAFGKGLEFFPDVEPERMAIHLRVRGNLSIYEIDSISKELEKKVQNVFGIKNVYAGTSIDSIRGEDVAEDTHAVIQVEFEHWKHRPTADDIIQDIKTHLGDAYGYIVEIKKEKAGPPTPGKPIQIEIGSRFSEKIEPALELVLEKMKKTPGLIDVSDSRPSPGVEWQMRVDREKASIFGADVESVGDAIQLVTNGIKISEYRPENSDEEVDIIIRYPRKFRSLLDLHSLFLNTRQGYVPVSNFVNQLPIAKTGRIERVNGNRVLTAMADVPADVLPSDMVFSLGRWLSDSNPLDPDMSIQFKGEDKEQRESQAFLFKSFLIAIVVMGIILVTQFNSFYQAFLILTAVVFSTIGVLLGLFITGQPFGVVMNGIGVVALAGIVVNNNIVLIDTYNNIKSRGVSFKYAVLKTCLQRLRPVLLTTITTILGLLPMVFKLNIDFWPFGENQSFLAWGAPSTQWWSQLATSIAFGLSFATLLTLVLTPSLIVLVERFYEKISHE